MLGLNYFHKYNIIHRDLTPANIMFIDKNCSNLDVMINNFGYSKTYDRRPGLDIVHATPQYMAPELIKKQVYSANIDVWSLGILVYHLLSGRTPFEADNILEVQKSILKKNVEFNRPEWSCISENAKDFILTCLEKDPINRLSINDLFDHPWICDVDETENEWKLENVYKNDVIRKLSKCNKTMKLQKEILNIILELKISQKE